MIPVQRKRQWKNRWSNGGRIPKGLQLSMAPADMVIAAVEGVQKMKDFNESLEMLYLSLHSKPPPKAPPIGHTVINFPTPTVSWGEIERVEIMDYGDQLS